MFQITANSEINKILQLQKLINNSFDLNYFGEPLEIYEDESSVVFVTDQDGSLILMTSRKDFDNIVEYIQENKYA